jgi:hypothetical protein
LTGQPLMKQLTKKILYLSASIMLWIAGCTHNAAKVSVSPAPSLAANAPHIVFESADCNLGSIGPKTMHYCIFKFRNAGSGVLEVQNVIRKQGCKSYTLFNSKKTYAPGETGTLEIPYNAGQQLGPVSENIEVATNDSNNPKITLTVKTVVEDKVYYEPRHIRLSFDKENAGCPKIILTSIDGKPFSIRDFSVNGNSIFAPINSMEKSSSYSLQPTVYIGLLRKRPQGEIRLTLDHPECQSIVIPFEALPEFEISPASITFVNAIPQKPVIRKIKVINNYSQPFTIESAVSDSNTMKILEQQANAKGYLLTIEIVPPDVHNQSFSDTLKLHTDDRDIEIKCLGFYDRRLISH